MYLDLRRQTTWAITELPARIFRRGLILRFTTLVIFELNAYRLTLRAPSTVCRLGHLANSYRATTRLDVLTKPSTFAFDRAVPTPSHVHTPNRPTTYDIQLMSIVPRTQCHRPTVPTPRVIRSLPRCTRKTKLRVSTTTNDNQRCPVPSVHAVPCPHHHHHRRNRFSSTPRPPRQPVPHLGSNASDTHQTANLTDSTASSNRSFPSNPTDIPSEIVPCILAEQYRRLVTTTPDRPNHRRTAAHRTCSDPTTPYNLLPPPARQTIPFQHSATQIQ